MNPIVPKLQTHISENPQTTVAEMPNPFWTCSTAIIANVTPLIVNQLKKSSKPCTKNARFVPSRDG